MKNTKACPKCSSAELIRVTGVAGPSGSNNVIHMGGLTLWNEIRVARYVCLSCGFSEEWIDNRDDLARLREAAENQGRSALGFLDRICGTPRFERIGGDNDVDSAGRDRGEPKG